MDIFTVLISLCLGFAGTLIFGGLLNIPDAGAIIAIAFIGGRIIYLLEKKQPESRKIMAEQTKN